MLTLEGKPFRFQNLPGSSYTKVVIPGYGEYTYNPSSDTLTLVEGYGVGDEEYDELVGLCRVHHINRQKSWGYQTSTVPSKGDSPGYWSGRIFNSADYQYGAKVQKVRSPSDGFCLTITGKQVSEGEELVKFTASLEREGIESLVRLLTVALKGEAVS